MLTSSQKITREGKVEISRGALTGLMKDIGGRISDIGYRRSEAVGACPDKVGGFAPVRVDSSSSSREPSEDHDRARWAQRAVWLNRGRVIQVAD